MPKKDEYRKLIADRMFYLRTAIFQMSQRDLCRLLEMPNYQTISQYERGTLRPSIQRCKQLIELAEQRGKKIEYRWLRPDIF